MILLTQPGLAAWTLLADHDLLLMYPLCVHFRYNTPGLKIPTGRTPIFQQGTFQNNWKGSSLHVTRIKRLRLWRARAILPGDIAMYSEDNSHW